MEDLCVLFENARTSRFYKTRGIEWWNQTRYSFEFVEVLDGRFTFSGEPLKSGIGVDANSRRAMPSSRFRSRASGLDSPQRPDRPQADGAWWQMRVLDGEKIGAVTASVPHLGKASSNSNGGITGVDCRLWWLFAALGALRTSR